VSYERFDTALEDQGEVAPSPDAEVEQPLEQSPPSFRSRKQLKYLALLMAGVLIMVLVGILIQKPSNPTEYIRTSGYAGVFLMAVIGSASPFWPLPGSWAAPLAAGLGLNPLLVGLAAGLGEPIGELSGYTAGYGGQVAIQKWKRYAQLESWMKRRGGLTIFLVSAIPNFFIKLVTIAAGALRYPTWKFFIFCWAGKTIKSVVAAYIGYSVSDWIQNLFNGISC
jgi:membrane protein DedA with SNARE-associated domain